MTMDASREFAIALSCYALATLIVMFRSHAADICSVILAVIGSIFGIIVAGSSFTAAHPIALISYRWQVPGGEIAIALDALSGAFLVIIFLIAAMGAIHGLAYWRRSDHPATATKLRIFYNVMIISLALVVTARHSVLFLVSWEAMAVSAYFLVATEDEVKEVRRAAWIYLVAAHVGTLSLFGAFALLRLQTGSYLIHAGLPPTQTMSVVFLLALLGFGFKAGLVPMHFWLPPAHANAPSHVSALMSGVMLKAGIYGILRITSLVTSIPIWWCFVLGAIAALTAITGIALALTQNDLKKALAYSSVENMGIVCLGIGLALAGRSTGNALWVVLGISGAMFHVWSHSIFKALLFYCSGGILHAVHSRSMDRMGGLLRRMPVTGTAFLIGSLSASGLPLFNGFIGELLIALGLFHAILSNAIPGWYLAFAAPVLALSAALALASFFRMVAVVFLGTPRTVEASHANESSRLMLIPIAFLAYLCIVMGVMPAILAQPMGALVSNWGGVPGSSIRGFLILPTPAFLAIAFVASPAALLMLLIKKRARRTVTWDCGYAEPTGRMQYTSSSSTEWFSQRVLPRSWRPASTIPKNVGLFPVEAGFQSDSSDPFSSGIYEPLVAGLGARFEKLRRLQQGNLTLYLIYIFVAMVLGVAWAVFRSYLR